MTNGLRHQASEKMISPKYRSCVSALTNISTQGSLKGNLNQNNQRFIAHILIIQPTGKPMVQKNELTAGKGVSDPGANAARNSPELMTESELIHFLRIPEVSHSKNYNNVVENLKWVHGLPRVHICGKPLYPRAAIREWIKKQTADHK